jgi:hypothetical protein
MIDYPESKHYWVAWAEIALIAENEAKAAAHERSVQSSKSGAKWSR